MGDQDIFDGTGMELRNLLAEPGNALCSPSPVCIHPGSVTRAGPQTHSRTGSNAPSPNVDTTGLGKRDRDMETRRTGTGDQRSSCHDQEPTGLGDQGTVKEGVFQLGMLKKFQDNVNSVDRQYYQYMKKVSRQSQFCSPSVLSVHETYPTRRAPHPTIPYRPIRLYTDSTSSISSCVLGTLQNSWYNCT